MKNRVLAALVAGGLLIGAALVSSAVSTPATASAQESGADSPEGGDHGVLAEVLDDLVAAGTIDQSQSDAIVNALEAKFSERREQRELLKTLFEDGVLTSEEAEQLPDDNKLLGDEFADAWEDGQLTLEEIREIRPHHRRRHTFRSGVRFGALLDDGGIDQGEYDSLDDDHPLKSIDVTEYLDDGLITPEELREIHSELRQANDNA